MNHDPAEMFELVAELRHIPFGDARDERGVGAFLGTSGLWRHGFHVSDYAR